MNIEQWIDWPTLGTNALWVFGMTALLALMSLRVYMQHTTRSMRIVAWASGLLVCIGFGLSLATAWQRVAWATLGVITVLGLIRAVTTFKQ